METEIGIFRGKAKENNKLLLETLYEKGPLTAWELSQETPKYGSEIVDRRSLHAIYNKRLRDLETKGYVQRAEKKWFLQFKGLLAVLLVQDKPKPWSTKWTNLFRSFVKPIMESPKKYAITADGEEIIVFKDFIADLVRSVESLEGWVALADRVKALMERGFVILDVISNETLCMLLLTESLYDGKAGADLKYFEKLNVLHRTTDTDEPKK